MSPTKFFPVLLLLTLGAMAPGDFANEKQEYERCIALSKADPEIAHTNAMTWRDTGGGLPARHCVALSLASLGRYNEAAVELEILASDLARGIGWPFADDGMPLDETLLADIYGQAGNAWLLADDPNKASEVLTLALSAVEPLSESYAQLLIDRATAFAGAGDFEESVKDLLMAESMLGESVWLFVLKANAYRSLEKYSEASTELDKAMALEPLNREALLELGNLRRAQGDNDGARAAWLEYLSLYSETRMAEAVRRNLEAMDVEIEEFENPEGQEN